MKIDVVAQAVLGEYHKQRAKGPDVKPHAAVYMDIDFWQECMSEIKGQVSSPAYEFFYDQKIYGAEVWKVLPIVHGIKGTKSHCCFRVVSIGE